MTELVIERSAPALEPVGDGWTVEGLAVPYDTPTRVSDDGVTFYREVFTPGAFTRDCESGGRWVNLFLGHHGDSGQRFLGRCVALAEDSEGLVASFALNRRHPQAQAARAGDLVGWSVSARVYRSRAEGPVDDRVVYRDACGLDHVAATAQPQYAGAGVRVAREHTMVVAAPPPSAAPRREALAAYLESLGTQGHR